MGSCTSNISQDYRHPQLGSKSLLGCWKCKDVQHLKPLGLYTSIYIYTYSIYIYSIYIYGDVSMDSLQLGVSNLIDPATMDIQPDRSIQLRGSWRLRRIAILWLNWHEQFPSKNWYSSSKKRYLALDEKEWILCLFGILFWETQMNSWHILWTKMCPESCMSHKTPCLAEATFSYVGFESV